MTVNKRDTKPAWVDPDDAPELTDEWFASADLKIAGKVVRRGRPKADTTKERITIRLSPDVVEHFRATGPGWQARIDAALRNWVSAH
ncbi:BrnA antitoxin family protein [Novosphingobium sp.]|uniref:BrnA antitoxin family protein n=1 Tax=Novosphingobium sp. TaxID=1874826 RepID=UPI002FDAE207